MKQTTLLLFLIIITSPYASYFGTSTKTGSSKMRSLASPFWGRDNLTNPNNHYTKHQCYQCGEQVNSLEPTLILNPRPWIFSSVHFFPDQTTKVAHISSQTLQFFLDQTIKVAHVDYFHINRTIECTFIHCKVYM